MSSRLLATVILWSALFASSNTRAWEMIDGMGDIYFGAPSDLIHWYIPTSAFMIHQIAEEGDGVYSLILKGQRDLAQRYDEISKDPFLYESPHLWTVNTVVDRHIVLPNGTSSISLAISEDSAVVRYEIYSHQMGTVVWTSSDSSDSQATVSVPNTGPASGSSYDPADGFNSYTVRWCYDSS